jgi:hypothetical protein
MLYQLRHFSAEWDNRIIIYGIPERMAEEAVPPGTSQSLQPHSDLALYKVEIKAKLSLWLIKYHCRSGGIAPRIHNLGTRWRWVGSLTLQPLYPRCPLDMRLYEPQSRSGRFGEEKKVSAPAGNWAPVVHLVPITTLTEVPGCWRDCEVHSRSKVCFPSELVLLPVHASSCETVVAKLRSALNYCTSLK